MSNTIVEILFFIVYTFFAVRWGIAIIDGRWKWLEQPEMKIVKVILSIIAGYVLFSFYVCICIFKFIGYTLPRWLS